MERIPGSQPKNIDSIDEMGLAVLGHVIELWNQALSDSEPFTERYEKLIKEMTSQTEALEDTDEPFLDELLEDLDVTEEFAGTPDDFTKFCEARLAYWTEVRRELIKTL